jgi:hypothetical protein
MAGFDRLGGGLTGSESGNPAGATCSRRRLRQRDALAVLGLLAVVLFFHSDAVPHNNEEIYLYKPYRLAHPEFLANDWTFSQPVPENVVFNVAVAGMMKVLPFELAGWLGRLVAWTVILIGLLKVGVLLTGSRLATLAGVTIWLGLGQAIVGGEWIFNGLEAKVVAYCFAIYSLERILHGRALAAALLAAGAFWLHPPVGLQVGIGVGAAAIALRIPLRQLATAGVLGLALALPMAVLLRTGSLEPASASDWEYLVRVAMAVHLDPLNTEWFPRRDVLTTILMAAYVVAVGCAGRDRPELRGVAAFMVGLVLIAAGGFAARILGAWSLLSITPFRLMPLFALLLFLLLLLREWRTSRITAAHAVRSGLALLCLLGLSSPLAGAVDRMMYVRQSGARPDPVGAAMDWIAQSTPSDAVVIVPPWRKDSFHRARRAQVVSWHGARIQNLGEWRRRMELLIGRFDDGTAPTAAAVEARYTSLSETDVLAVAREFGARYFLGRQGLALATAHETGGYAVYDLRAALEVGCADDCPSVSRESVGQAPDSGHPGRQAP